MSRLVECVPNFSEGRRREVVDEIMNAIAAVPGVTLLDTEMDPDHNRSVLTFAGEPEPVMEAAFRAVQCASKLIDLNHHTGQHPRMGAADVVPFVPVENCTLDDCAASIVTTVVSTAKKGQIIIDGGSKTFSSDRSATGTEVSFGLLPEAPEAVFTKMNEEHGYVDVRRVKRDFTIGDRVRVIPNHVCVAVNLHERIYGFRGDKVEQTWKVEARGKLQ